MLSSKTRDLNSYIDHRRVPIHSSGLVYVEPQPHLLTVGILLHTTLMPLHSQGLQALTLVSISKHFTSCHIHTQPLIRPLHHSMPNYTGYVSREDHETQNLIHSWLKPKTLTTQGGIFCMGVCMCVCVCASYN